MKPKAALLIDNLKLNHWQKEALDAASKKIDIVLVLNCKNTFTKKNFFKHFLYYLLNIFSLKNSQTKNKKYENPNIEIFNFNSSYNGIWQSIPIEGYEKIVKKEIKLIIKFGMNLLRIDEKFDNLTFLSFHHGDPSKYRGRPAGFYEILNGELTSGIIVQKLSNKIDAGKIFAFAESKVIKYSYKETAKNFYINSKHLLSKAIDNLTENKDINIKKSGKNYHLPSNTTVMNFIYLLIFNKIKRIGYGLFFEKKWRIALAPHNLNLNKNEKISLKNITNIKISPKYNFYADPFFSIDGNSIRYEALNNKNGLGDIIEIPIQNFTEQKKLLTGLHYSYPLSFVYKDKEYLLPEVASHSPQYIFSLNEENNKKFILRGLENKRIVDSTIVEENNHWFLFFGENTSADTQLNLWFSDSPFGIFKPHPETPIAISPKIARMGGALIKNFDGLFRFGQNNSNAYGESLTVLKILKLSPTEYLEKIVGNLSIDDFKGPHSLSINTKSKQILFDYYKDKFSLFAGIRRIRSLLSKK